MYNYLAYDQPITNITNINKIINNICNTIYNTWYNMENINELEKYVKKVLQLNDLTFNIINHILIYIERIKKSMINKIELPATCENCYLYCGYTIFTLSLI